MLIDFILAMNSFVLLLIVVLVFIVGYKVLIKRDKPTSTYTPFDYIMGQTSEEFLDETEKETDYNKD